MSHADSLDSLRRRSDWLWYAGLLLLAFLLGCFPMMNWDIWWHMRTGQLIWQRGEVPQTDWFTYTNPDAEWIDLHWGFQLLAAGLWTLGGSAALVLAKSAIGTAAIGLCLTIGRRDWPAWQTAACWLTPLLLFAWRYYVRPEILTLLFLAATLAILYHARRRPRLLWLLPVVQLLWVNVQGLFVLQFVALGCFLADAAVRNVWAWGVEPSREEPKWRWPTLLAASGLTAVASLCNPYGLRGASYPLILFQRVQGSDREFYHNLGSELMGFAEFIRRVGFGALFEHTSHLLLGLVFGAGLVTFGMLLARKRLDLFRLLIFVAFAYLTWQMRRNGVLFALVGGVALRLNVGELVDLAKQNLHKRHVTKSQESEEQLEPPLPIPRLVALLLAVLIVSVPTGLFHKAYTMSPPRSFGWGEHWRYTHAAVEFLGQPGMPKYIYATNLGQAAMCSYFLGPETRVFADARLETHKRETFELYWQIRDRLTANDPQAEELLRRHVRPGADGKRELPALLIDNRTLGVEPQLLYSLVTGNRWRCVFFEFDADAFERNSMAIFEGTAVFVEEARAERLGLPAADVSPLIEFIVQTGQMRGGTR